MHTSWPFSSLTSLLSLGSALLTWGAGPPFPHAPTPSGQPLATLLVPPGAVVLRQPLNALLQRHYWLVPTDSLPVLADRQLDRPFAAAGVSLRALTHALLHQQALDTSAWQPSELPQASVVASYLASLPPLPREPSAIQDRAALRQRRRYNHTPPVERYLYQVSRPAFDSTGHFAAVLQQSGTRGLVDTRLLVLVKRADGWYLLGIARRWSD